MFWRRTVSARQSPSECETVTPSPYLWATSSISPSTLAQYAASFRNTESLPRPSVCSSFARRSAGSRKARAQRKPSCGAGMSRNTFPFSSRPRYSSSAALKSPAASSTSIDSTMGSNSATVSGRPPSPLPATISANCRATVSPAARASSRNTSRTIGCAVQRTDSPPVSFCSSDWPPSCSSSPVRRAVSQSPKSPPIASNPCANATSVSVRTGSRNSATSCNRRRLGGVSFCWNQRSSL